MNTEQRISRLLGKLEEIKADAVLITNLANVFYLTGFTGSTAYLVLSPQRYIFVTDFRYHEQFAQQVSGYELFDNSAKSLDKALAEIKDMMGINTLAIEGSNLTVNQYAQINSIFSSEAIITTTDLVEELRMVKDAQELEKIQQAVKINELAFLDILEWFKLGVTEFELAAEHEYRIRKYGASSSSFDPIIASGLNSSKPHAGVTSATIVPSAPLTIDIGALFNKYCSDMTRTVFVKDCPGHWEKIYNIVLEAKNAAVAQLRAGKTGREIDKIARDVIAEAGFGDKFGHGLGHGVGINVHEQPRLSATYDKELPSGAVVTVEPGIYLPGEGGIRIEDMYVITDNGCTRLNSISADLTIIG